MIQYCTHHDSCVDSFRFAPPNIQTLPLISEPTQPTRRGLQVQLRPILNSRCKTHEIHRLCDQVDKYVWPLLVKEPKQQMAKDPTQPFYQPQRCSPPKLSHRPPSEYSIPAPLPRPSCAVCSTQLPSLIPTSSSASNTPLLQRFSWPLAAKHSHSERKAAASCPAMMYAGVVLRVGEAPAYCPSTRGRAGRGTAGPQGRYLIPQKFSHCQTVLPKRGFPATADATAVGLLHR
jgi:hypothetical protein